MKFDPSTSILHLSDTPITPGRYSGGPKPEDIDFLVDWYNRKDESGFASSDEFVALDNIRVFKLQKLAGLPGNKAENIINNERTNKRIANMLNDAQSNWVFTFVLKSSMRRTPDVAYKIDNVKKVGQKRKGLLNI